MAEPDLDGVRALTFDCYGTLIDWDRGIRSAMAAIPALEGSDLEQLLRSREIVERDIEAGPFRPYTEVLMESLGRVARDAGRQVPEHDLRTFAESLGSWPAFDESRDALARMAQRFRLAILSNVDTAPLQRSVRALGAPFAACVTAEEVRSYKPGRAHFEEGLRRLELGPEEVLHVSLSWFHDIVPAREVGLRVAWVNRLGDPPGQGPGPTLEVETLQQLCARLDV